MLAGAVPGPLSVSREIIGRGRAVAAGGQVGPWKQLPSKCHYTSLSQPSSRCLFCSAVVPLPVRTWYVVSYVLALPLFNHLIFAPSPLLSLCHLHTFTPPVTMLPPPQLCGPLFLPGHSGRSSPSLSTLLLTLHKTLVMRPPFWSEIAECTVAPVAMEDSDHEAHSSSDEQDSPNHSRDHDAEQVLVPPPQTKRKHLLTLPSTPPFRKPWYFYPSALVLCININIMCAESHWGPTAKFKWQHFFICMLDEPADFTVCLWELQSPGNAL